MSAETINWITKDDLITQFGNYDLPRDDNNVVDDVKIAEAIDSGVLQVEAYLRNTGITIPFSLNIQSELKLIAIDIVRYKYSNDLQNGTKDVLERYNAAISYLNKVASGKIKLSESQTKTSGSVSFIELFRG